MKENSLQELKEQVYSLSQELSASKKQLGQQLAQYRGKLEKTQSTLESKEASFEVPPILLLFYDKLLITFLTETLLRKSISA